MDTIKRYYGLSILLLLLTNPVIGRETQDEIPEELIHDTVSSVAKIVEREYFNPQVGERIRTALEQQLAKGRFAETTKLTSLAEKITDHLLQVSRDKHLAVLVSAPRPEPPTAEQSSDASREVAGRRTNFGVQRVEILAGNVGYLNITSFYRPDEVREVLAAALLILQNTVLADDCVAELKRPAHFLF